MLACTGIFVTEAGFRWPGYLSKSLDLKFEDVPGTAAYESLSLIHI